MNKLKDYYVEIVGVILGGLFVIVIAIGTAGIATWSRSVQNAANLAEDRKTHEAGGKDRFTRTNAERMEDRQEIKNEVMREEILDLIKEIWFLKGQQAQE